jgi:hypothetical protein
MHLVVDKGWPFPLSLPLENSNNERKIKKEFCYVFIRLINGTTKTKQPIRKCSSQFKGTTNRFNCKTKVSRPPTCHMKLNGEILSAVKFTKERPGWDHIRPAYSGLPFSDRDVIT